MEVPAFAAGSCGRGTRPGWRGHGAAFMPGLRRVWANTWNGCAAMNTGWSSWGDRIAPITDVATAAFKLACVLTPTQI